jgi:protein mago nashi
MSTEEIVETTVAEPQNEDFYLRYYTGHTGKFGREFLEFELRRDGTLRYGNDSQYRRDVLIRKEVSLNKLVVEEFKKLVQESAMLDASDENWPLADAAGRQEIEIVWGNKHIFFVTSKIGSFSELAKMGAEESLVNFHYLTQELKSLVFSLINLHFKIKPV